MIEFVQGEFDYSNDHGELAFALYRRELEAGAWAGVKVRTLWGCNAALRERAVALK